MCKFYGIGAGIEEKLCIAKEYFVSILNNRIDDAVPIDKAAVFRL